MVTGVQAKDIGDNAQAAASADTIGTDAWKPSVDDYSKFLFPSAPNRNHRVSPAASEMAATQPGDSIEDDIGRYPFEYAGDEAASRAQDSISPTLVRQRNARSSSTWPEDPSKET